MKSRTSEADSNPADEKAAHPSSVKSDSRDELQMNVEELEGD